MLDTALLVSMDHVSKTYQTAGAGRLVLDQIDFRLGTGEIVAVLGKSGSGKSTFLRLIAGLTEPTGGEIRYRGAPVVGPIRGAGMVFQTFALFPWLTVLGNVELGLESLGVPPGERRERAVAAIDLIGLDGFESAYPKELSGGMRQRVGFARALVINPDILLLDEPFSALDVLTAETLRGDLVDLWLEHKIPTRSILLVSHNIEESVEMADRIVIFGSDPGHIRAEVPVALPRPRDWNSAGFRQAVDHIYAQLTARAGQIGKRGVRGEVTAGEGIGLYYRLPDAAVQQLSGLIDTLMEERFRGRADLPVLAEYASLETDDLLPLLETLQLLGFANVAGGDIELTAVGRAYSEADLQERKRIFAGALVRQIPLAAHIGKVLEERPGHRAPAARFLTELEDHLSDEDAAKIMETIINWGRHAEMFAYDYDSEVFYLEAPDE